MIIDWYTIIFQIINFLILVFLLRYFLYGPIIRVMDDREKKMIEREEEAAKQREKADQEAAAYREKSEELKQQEEKIREKAFEEAEKEKHELLRKARREVDETRNRWEEAFEREKETFIGELRRRIGQQSCSIARSCLSDLADSHLEELILDQFHRKIEELPEKELKALKKAISESDSRVLLRSAFELPEGRADKLKQSLQKNIRDKDSDGAVNLSVKTDPELICGLELKAGGYHIAWNIDSYLEDLEEEIMIELEHSAVEGKAGEVPAGDKRES